MLTAVNGHIDGNRVIVEENIADWQGRNVVVTILDSSWEALPKTTRAADEERRKNAAKELAGLWKNHEVEKTVEDTVRNLRKGRQFDF